MKDKRAELLSEYENARLTKIASDILDEISQGNDPNDVVYKKAVEHNLDLPFIQRICQTVNVGNSISLFKTAANRDLEFPIADLNTVVTKLYSSDKSANKSNDYIIAKINPKIQKEDEFDDVEDIQKPEPYKQANQFNRMVKLYNSLEQVWETSRFEAESKKMAFIDKLQEIQTYFLRNPESFEAVDARVTSGLGKSAKEIINLVYDVFDLQKQTRIKVASSELASAFVDSSKAPYRQINEALTLFSEFTKAANILQIHTYGLAKMSQLLGFEKFADNGEKNEKSNPAPKPKDTKKDSLSSTILNASAKIKNLFDPDARPAVVTKNDSKPIDRYFYRPAVTGPNSISTKPEFAEYKALRASATLHDIIQNDEVLKSADPDLVAKTFNDLIGINPLAADQPLLLRNILRKTVIQNGVIEPYELSQLADISKKLQEQDSNNLKAYLNVPAK